MLQQEAEMDVNQIWELERRFWLEGTPLYEECLHDEARMIFPGLGILDRVSILDSLRKAPRWNEIEMSDRDAVEAGDTVFLAYLALARRRDRSYRSACGSIYVRSAKGWVMLAHQQTLLD